MKRLRTIAVALFAVGLLGVSAPVNAQLEPPPLPLPTIPPEAQPILEVIAPIVSPQCGNATLVVALAPALLGAGTLPVNPLPYLGPVFVLCGSVPVPDQSSLLVCAVDDQILALASAATVAAIGTPPPVDIRLVGPLAEILYVLEDNLPPPANAGGTADQVKGLLACRAARESTGSTTAPAEVEASAEEAAIDNGFNDILLPEISSGLGAIDADIPTELGAASTPLPSGGILGGPGFAYPIVFALPLLVLALAGYLGRALSRKVDPPKS